MDQRLPGMLVRGNSPCVRLAGVTPATWPTQCSLLLSAPLPPSTQSLKGSLTGPRRSYWCAFHLALLCPCPPAAEVDSRSPLTSAVLEYVSCLAEKREVCCDGAQKAGGEAGAPAPSIVILLLFIIYHNCCFTVNCCSSENVHRARFLFGTDREGASQKIPEDFWDHKPQKDNKISTHNSPWFSLCLLTTLVATLLSESLFCLLYQRIQVGKC